MHCNEPVHNHKVTISSNFNIKPKTRKECKKHENTIDYRAVATLRHEETTASVGPDR